MLELCLCLRKLLLIAGFNQGQVVVDQIQHFLRDRDDFRQQQRSSIFNPVGQRQRDHPFVQRHQGIVGHKNFGSERQTTFAGRDLLQAIPSGVVVCTRLDNLDHLDFFQVLFAQQDDRTYNPRHNMRGLRHLVVKPDFEVVNRDHAFQVALDCRHVAHRKKREPKNKQQQRNDAACDAGGDR